MQNARADFIDCSFSNRTKGGGMERANVRGSTIEYEILGSGEPVLLIQGALVADGLRPLVQEDSLARRYKLIVYHRRGVAGSDGVPSPYTLEDQAADAQTLLGELGVERAHVVGHSYGAAIALQLAADALEVMHNTGVAGSPIGMVPSAEQVIQSMEPVGQRFASGDREGAADDFMTAMGAVGYREPLDRLLPGSFEQAVDDADAFFTVEFPALGEWAFSAEDAKRIDVPVLRVLGENSIPWFIESDALLGEWLPNSERSTIPGVGHFLQIEDPRPIAESLATFFARHSMK
jgi:pimeloyl-ACP methyl ester carboxylesterase